MENLKQMIVNARNGDLNAFGDLVRRFQNMVYGYAFGLLGDFHLAEDAAQEAFLEAYRRLPELRNPEAFSGWLRSIAFKYCDRITRRKRAETVALDDVPELAASTPEPDVRVERRELASCVARAIRTLPEAERTVTALFYMNAHSLKEISAFLHVPVSTVKNRLHSARLAIKERLADMVDDRLNVFRLPDRFADVVVQMQFVLGKIDPLESRMQALRDDQLPSKSEELKRRLARGEDRDDIKAEAFALVREASRRALGMAHFDVQLAAGLMMDDGWVAEVASGEGKSLTCLPPAFLAVLEGKRVHVATVSEALAERDAAMAKPVFSLLGIAVGAIGEGKDNRAAYACDVVYGTYTAFAFDGLRDGMRKAGDSAVQRTLDFAIVDEADRVLIQEGRTPVVFARSRELDENLYRTADQIARTLIAQEAESGAFFAQDAKHAYSLKMTPTGEAAMRNSAGDRAEVLHQVEQSLRAHLLYRENRDYVVDGDCVVILDSESGRRMPGRRFSDGVHQALEVKEDVTLKPEIRTEGVRRVQDHFRGYSKLAGITGTAHLFEDEFRTRYHLPVGIVPTRRPVNRVDYEDRVYADGTARDEAIVAEVAHCRAQGRPVLVGVTSLAASERISKVLAASGIAHRVLDARPERAAQEAKTLALAGRRDAVTIATEMGGRGTDIRVSERAQRAGGLHVVGVGRHSLRHLDEQLKARAGRQGEPGSCRFCLCRDDELVQAVWADLDEATKRTLEREGVVEGRWISELIAIAQARFADAQFEVRKKLDAIGSP